MAFHGECVRRSGVILNWKDTYNTYCPGHFHRVKRKIFFARLARQKRVIARFVKNIQEVTKSIDSIAIQLSLSKEKQKQRREKFGKF